MALVQGDVRRHFATSSTIFTAVSRQLCPGTGLAHPVRVQWIAAMRESMRFVVPELRERLIACHHQVGPHSQHDDLVVIDQFDVRHRISTLTPPLLLIRGVDDSLTPEEYEREIHEAVSGSQYLTLREAGHFPMAEQPAAVNRAIATFLDTLDASQAPPQRGVLSPT